MCLLLLGSFLTSSSVLAQEPIEKSGELVGGHSDSIPIQLELGEVVQGEIIASNEPLRVTIDDPAGKEVQNYGSITHGSFSYQARIAGKHYIVVTNPNTITVRKRAYTLTYTILPASSFPSPLPPEGPNITPWVIIGSIWAVAFGLIIYLVIKNQSI